MRLIYGCCRPRYWPLVINKQRLYSTAKSPIEPLRILFCGSDEFSATSLERLHQEHVRDKEFIASLDVVCKQGKPSGRGLKTIRDVPAKKLAQDFKIPLHEIPTFTGWSMPIHEQPINLIIAVSFGLLVPARLLNQARYGGLNVHPSLLPDLRGPAPLHHTLLEGRTVSGITIQTLHPRHFDQGNIIAQSQLELPKNGQCSLEELRNYFATKAPSLLIETLRNGHFAAQSQDITSTFERYEKVTHARKVSPEDAHVDWQSWPAERVLRAQRAMGQVWSIEHHEKYEKPMRVQWHELQEQKTDHGNDLKHTRIGQPVPIPSITGAETQVALRTCDNRILSIGSVTVEGKKRTKAVSQALKL